MDGLLLIDKPVGPTSHDVVARVRRALGERRAGHTGTLDPAASGLLPVVVGRATRLARFVASRDKRYETTIRLGVETETYDAEGAPVASSARIAETAMPTRAEIERALEAFRGTYEQQPPAFSAKKIGGRRSYAVARGQGAGAVRPAAAVVTAYAIDVLALRGDTLTLAVVCSAGFYVRSLAHDLGAALGIGAHVVGLRRTRSGTLDVVDALPLDAIEADPGRAQAALVPLSRMLPELASVVLTTEGVRYATHGRPIGADQVAGERTVAQPFNGHEPNVAQPFQGCEAVHIRLMHPDGDLVGIAAPGPGGLLHPSVILM